MQPGRTIRQVACSGLKGRAFKRASKVTSSPAPGGQLAAEKFSAVGASSGRFSWSGCRGILCRCRAEMFFCRELLKSSRPALSGWREEIKVIREMLSASRGTLFFIRETLKLCREVLKSCRGTLKVSRGMLIFCRGVLFSTVYAKATCPPAVAGQKAPLGDSAQYFVGAEVTRLKLKRKLETPHVVSYL